MGPQGLSRGTWDLVGGLEVGSAQSPHWEGKQLPPLACCAPPAPPPPGPGLPHCQGDGIIPIYLSGSGLVPTCPPALCLSLLWQWGDASCLPPYLQLAPLPAARC